MNLDGYAKLPSKKTTFDFHSYQQWLSTCFPQHSSIKQLCMKHQAGLTPLPWPRSATGEAITAPMSVRPGRRSSDGWGLLTVHSSRL